VLATLFAEISRVGAGVGEVPGRGVMHDGLGDLAEGGHHSVNQGEDEQETRHERGCYEVRVSGASALSRTSRLQIAPKAAAPARNRIARGHAAARSPDARP